MANKYVSFDTEVTAPCSTIPILFTEMLWHVHAKERFQMFAMQCFDCSGLVIPTDAGFIRLSNKTGYEPFGRSESLDIKTNNAEKVSKAFAEAFFDANNPKYIDFIYSVKTGIILFPAGWYHHGETNDTDYIVGTLRKPAGVIPDDIEIIQMSYPSFQDAQRTAEEKERNARMAKHQAKMILACE